MKRKKIKKSKLMAGGPDLGKVASLVELKMSPKAIAAKETERLRRLGIAQ